MNSLRTYGKSGPPVVVLHGGPGAPGYMAPAARGLADVFRVYEPFQRSSGDEPLTVARHVADLQSLVERIGADCDGARPALVGHSWGAMLALAYAAAHPGYVTTLVLVGCGTFDPAARARMRETVDGQMDDELRLRLERLPEEILDPDERLSVMGELLLPLYSHELFSTGPKIKADARAHRESWEDMMRLQAAGIYPAAFAAIEAPVLMLHGDVDPHPGEMIRESLEPHIPQLVYHEWQNCGHYPWLELSIRDDFFAVLDEWLAQQFTGASLAVDL
jgi:pimeloyl-ACP methyl ester carboxylesterase